ncbi:MAG: DNA primase [Acidobacteria bacterium]|nr:DNA primase [Acidobacteriota bacterium]
MSLSGFREYVEAVRSATDIVAVVGESVSLRKAGRSMTGLCPFHQEKTPSFHVDPAKQVFYCFGCSVGGDVFRFLMELHRVDFAEAVRMLGDRHNIPRPARAVQEPGGDRRRRRILEALDQAQAFFTRQLAAPGGEPARKYLERRKIPLESASSFGLGFAPAGWDNLLRHLSARGFTQDELLQSGLVVPRTGNAGAYDRFRERLTFPIRDTAGRVVSFGGRAIGDADPKYLNGSESLVYDKGRSLFRLFETSQEIRQSGRTVVVEGYFDAVSLALVGVPGVVAVCGTALGPEHARLLKRWTDRVVLLFDGDAAGRRAAHRAIAPLLDAGLAIRFACPPDGQDPDDLAREHGKDGVEGCLAAAEDLAGFLVAEARRGNNLTTVEGRVSALEMVLSQVVLLVSPVARAEVLGRVADGLGIEDDLLRQELRRVARERRKELRVPVGRPPADGAVMRDAERVLLRYLAGLAGPDPSGKSRVAEQDRAAELVESIPEEALGSLAAQLVSAWKQARLDGETWGLQEMAAAAPEASRGQVLQLAFAVGSEPDEEQAAGAVTALREAWLARRLRQVQVAIEKASDAEEKQRLIVEKLGVAREMRALRDRPPQGLAGSGSGD